MARERIKVTTELAGEVVAWLIHCIPAAVWSPKDLPKPLNPFRTTTEMSEAMRRHLESWNRRRWRVMAGG